MTHRYNLLTQYQTTDVDATLAARITLARYAIGADNDPDNAADHGALTAERIGDILARALRAMASAESHVDDLYTQTDIIDALHHKAQSDTAQIMLDATAGTLTTRAEVTSTNGRSYLLHVTDTPKPEMDEGDEPTRVDQHFSFETITRATAACHADNGRAVCDGRACPGSLTLCTDKALATVCTLHYANANQE